MDHFLIEQLSILNLDKQFQHMTSNVAYVRLNIIAYLHTRIRNNVVLA